ncbi:feruloyl esterase-like protein [Postia placenta Mad-698-R]|nr:feruloyl esterase-like protein [Postia placenta Mad-698-R]
MFSLRRPFRVVQQCLLALLLHSTTCLGQAGQSGCLSFTLGDLSNVTLSRATYYAANTTVNSTNLWQSIDVDNLPAFCRLELSITTNSTADSSCVTEIWLPDSWNGRILTVGNGGYAGGGASLTCSSSFAVAGISTDTGHSSTATDGTWGGPHNDNTIVDWGWRAMHLSVVVGKEVVKQYYGEAQNTSYYMGCSTGNLDALLKLKEVQMFPEDFDGVIVGSPANWQTRIQDWSVHMNLNVQPNTSARFIPESVWVDVIHPEVLRQCDAIDGLADGIINDPRFCDFRPETLTCRPGQNESTCLTLAQLGAVHRIYTDYYEFNQEWINGRYYPGGETEYPLGLVGKPFIGGQEWFQYFVLNDTQWKLEQYNASLIRLADGIDPGQANAIDRNLTAFAGPGHNGKLLQYVGWADQLISPGNSIHYYESVYAFTRAYTDLDINDFYRLFTVPGMNHWYVDISGYSANAFGGVQQASGGMPPLSLSPENNVLAAMVQWVEEGVAPTSFVAVHYNDNNVEDGVAFTRPLCQYPTSLRYTGGNETDAGSFECGDSI